MPKLLIKRNRPRRTWRLVMLAIGLSGCATPPEPAVRRTRAQSDVLRGHYADLASGRFAVIADFEDAEHVELFKRWTNRVAEPTSQPERQPVGGVPGTGGACLSVEFPSAEAELVADNTATTQWVLKRDWRPYQLLLMNVHSPEPGLRLDVAIVGGSEEFESEVHSLIPLRPGWNPLRLDLNEARDFIALDDVRQIRWSLPGLDHPVTLKIDDVLLADNRTVVFGDDDAEAGRLYVVREGRRIHIGAHGRFEFAFANGQIVRWYALDTDPLRTKDRVGPGNALGPAPVVWSRAGGEVEHAARWSYPGSSPGKVITTRQRVVEANDVRVIVECAWSLGEAEAEADAEFESESGTDAADGPGAGPEVKAASPEDADAPFQRWTFVIYPSGNVYVTVTCATGAETSTTEDLGLVVSLAAAPGMSVGVHEPGRSEDRPILENLAYGWFAGSDEESGLLWVLQDGRAAPRVKVVRAADDSRVSVGAFGGQVAHPEQRWHCLMNVWPKGNCAEAAHQAAAVSFCHRPRMTFLVGELVRDSMGDDDGDGFNERDGTYVVRPDANRVQIRLDGRERRMVNPAFCVQGVGRREAWVYVDYIIHEPLARDAEGRLLFEIPGVVADEMIVEVYLRDGRFSPPDGG